ncbi:stabilizer of axonemal microtubules 2-like [Venturia canescens]|uniref:stabilizer of axonemal microtubules 2-like n=1 Tax=Venturia canescens TaxID=32260 RepID=UPI001C9D52BF|nr:stabilizer of axonemal microtubules 2-like [Venturia canescens]
MIDSPKNSISVQCTGRYVQPARVESYAPERTYCPPTKPLDANTTYHLSYLKQTNFGRPESCRPKQSIERITGGKFEDGTTSKMSYQPVWGVVRAKPILPRRRFVTPRGKMDCISEARQAYSAKTIRERPEIIIPCGNIRTSSGALDASTTSGLSYLNPGFVHRTPSFKPTLRYSPPKEPTAKDTTSKLSYQPLPVARRETYPWAMKPVYNTDRKRPPEAAMAAQTTYSKSFLADGLVPTREKPFAPRPTMTLLSDEKFVGKTIYSESFLPCESEVIVPVVPTDNIALSNDKMACDTTSKLSYQPVKMEKRPAIRPTTKSTLMDGPMQTETTNRHDFVPVSVPRPEVIVPCDNIRTRDDVPLEGRTTAGLSYIDPGPAVPVQSFKPRAEYMKPSAKIDSETVNKLSYQSWGPVPKQGSLKPRRDEYQLPKERMASDTIYHMSFPMPGYFIEEDCEPSGDAQSVDVSSSTDVPKTDDAFRNS